MPTTYGYARVSSRGQAAYGNGLDAQRQQLKAAGATRIFEDVLTGTTMDRPQWHALMDALAPGDTLVVAKLDRVARTATEGCEAVRDLLARGVSVRVLNMGLVEDTPVGRMMLTVMFAMAEFERDLIAERMAAGKEVARQRDGWREGRPRRLSPDSPALAGWLARVNAREATVAEACESLGVSRSTWYRMAREVAAS